ncbi:oxygen-insensitive NAD(P)H nitroreductase [Dechloromonas sp. ZY10]|uniref:oxygen-insensitive NAD(P)H nitroreductase n=1 Tax=Dechloromonas aquae TaxID=2664436 RepID=UPI0035285F61
MNIVEHAKSRHTTKAFAPESKIPAGTFAQFCTLLRHSPSSVNSQPWHFVVASTDASKARIAQATETGYAYNAAKIRNASHVIVFCARTSFDANHLADLLAQEERDGRFATPEAQAGQNSARSFYVDLHRYDAKDLQHWMEKQVYLALGSALLGASGLGIDACPMEGFDACRLDEELGLRARGLTSVVILSLGYRSEEDFNARLPKSRLPEDKVFTML